MRPEFGSALTMGGVGRRYGAGAGAGAAAAAVSEEISRPDRRPGTLLNLGCAPPPAPPVTLTLLLSSMDIDMDMVEDIEAEAW